MCGCMGEVAGLPLKYWQQHNSCNQLAQWGVLQRRIPTRCMVLRVQAPQGYVCIDNTTLMVCGTKMDAEVEALLQPLLSSVGAVQSTEQGSEETARMGPGFREHTDHIDEAGAAWLARCSSLCQCLLHLVKGCLL